MEPELADGFVFKATKSVSIALPKGDSVGSRGAIATNQLDGDLDETAVDDAVVWPTNRCCYEELTPVELSAVEQLFVARDDSPSLIKWVVLHHHGRFDKQLLVVSSLRVWLLCRRQTPFSSALVVASERQLLHLDDITVLRLSTIHPGDATAISVSIKLRFHPPQHHLHHDADSSTNAEECSTNQTSSSRDHSRPWRELHMDPGIHAENIVRLLQRLLHDMRLVFPAQRLPRLLLPPQCHWHEFFTVREPPPSSVRQSQGTVVSHRKELGDAMATAYRSFCDDLRVPFRASVATRLRECLDSACVDVQHCLRTVAASALGGGGGQPMIPARHYGARGAGWLTMLGRLVGLDAFSASAVLAKEALALARTLEHGHCFEDIVVHDFAVQDDVLISLFHALLAPPLTAGSAAASVKGLALTNVELTTKALRTLQHIVLQSSIKRSTNTSFTNLQLRRLDLSFNSFSMMMASGLATILELLPSGLEALQLEQCRLSMLASARILSAMKASHGFSSCLRELNLSGNTLGIEGTRALALWITGAFALHRLDLSRTRLQTNLFFQSFKQNSILHESSLTALDLSYNRMGSQASLDLGDVMGKSQSLATLVLRGMKQTLLHPKRVVTDLLVAHGRRNKKLRAASAAPKRTTNGLRKIHLQNILGPMLQNSSRTYPCLVDLSENSLLGAKATTLAHLIDSAPNASLLSLRLDYAELTDKAAVLLLHSLRGVKTLQSLSLEGNGFAPRNTKRSYKQFHTAPVKHVQLAPAAPTALERAAGDALSLLLGGKTTAHGADPNANADANGRDGRSDSFTHLYHHRPKKVPLRELSLRAHGAHVFGGFILATAIQALAANATLQLLDVSGNECGDALATALGAALPENKTLRVLYWDDNFTTVDGFFAFYEGLLRNQTLSVVQLPINDTRRILEEQKDPPREKLFSVLGKIFKVTERNQTLAQAAKDHKHSTPTSRKTSVSPRHQKSANDQKRANERKEAAYPSDQATSDNPADDTVEQQPKRNTGEPPLATSDKSSTNAPTSALHVDVALHELSPSPSPSQSEVAWSSVRSKYPTTIKNWSTGGGSVGVNDDLDVRASWNQIGALASMLT